MNGQRMVFLGFGKYARADKIYAIEPIRDERRGHGRRTLVWVEGVSEPIVASRTERTILADMGQDSALQELRREVRLEIRDVIAVRRAVDLLRRRADVDPARIGFVGWSAGARTGAILAGVERRLRAIVLMSAGAAPVSVYSARAPAALRPTVRRALSRVDPLRYIRHAKGSALLLQDGRRDAVVPRAALAALARAAPRGTAIRWYDAGHALDVKAYREQLAWLTRKLGIGGPPVKGALTGP